MYISFREGKLSSAAIINCLRWKTQTSWWYKWRYFEDVEKSWLSSLID